LVIVDNRSKEHAFVEAEKGNHDAVLDQNAFPGDSQLAGAGGDDDANKEGGEPHRVGPGDPLKALIVPVATLSRCPSLFLDGRGVHEEGQKVVQGHRRVGTPGGARAERRSNVIIERFLETVVFCFAHKEEKEEGFKEADEKDVEGEAEDAAVPALAGRVGVG